MGVVGIAIKGFGKALKKPGHAFTRAGDKWYKKTQKLQRSKKKFERIRGNMRIIAPMAVSGTVGLKMGVRDAKEEIKKRTHAAGQIAPLRSLSQDLKSGMKNIKSDIKKIKKKFKKK